MDALLDHFPVFESNQVLTSRHLNEAFDYLEQQGRLTRSHLIGIGIVCGFEIKLDTSAGLAIGLSKGSGVTSEGYLIVEPDDVTLVSYNSYSIDPPVLDYSPFRNPADKTQYPLWELFPSGEPNTTVLDDGFLADKAMLLFLEPKKEGLRNCSPNNCDDKGSEVTATVRPLLIARSDLDAIVAAAEGLGSGLTARDIDAALAARLDLPDLRLRRFDVPNSRPTTSEDVYTAFFDIFRSADLAASAGKALSDTYTAFKPVLEDAYPTDPFANFPASFGFLDTAPSDVTQVHFLQYYADLFDDLVRAYDEFRWAGLELVSACCPPEELFPRHLMLGVLYPEEVARPQQYRQPFMPSPAVGGCCAGKSGDVTRLFARLVEMAASFSNKPSLPKDDDKARLDPQIKITPSTLGVEPLAAKAIPYYYEERSELPLYRLWSPEKTQRHRAQLNLSYRAVEYIDPAAPDFVINPLPYDLEPYNFLRIEGHLGKSFERVVQTLGALTNDYRLPIDIIALRTGAVDEKDGAGKDAIDDDDLIALYGRLREGLLRTIADAVRTIYDVPSANEIAAGTPRLDLLKTYEPNYRFLTDTMGAYIESLLPRLLGVPFVDFDPDNVTTATTSAQMTALFINPLNARFPDWMLHILLHYLFKLADQLPADLAAVDYTIFKTRLRALGAMEQHFRPILLGWLGGPGPVGSGATNPTMTLRATFVCDRIAAIEHEALDALLLEYQGRLAELRKGYLLSEFLRDHPGIQHKAGVPVGGTFIVVYHGAPVRDGSPGGMISRGDEIRGGLGKRQTIPDDSELEGERTSSASAEVNHPPKELDSVLVDAIQRIEANRAWQKDPDLKVLINSLTGKREIFKGQRPIPRPDDPVARIIDATVEELDNGTVIADFFLPYRVSRDRGMTYVFPAPTPVPTPIPEPVFGFKVDLTCTDKEGNNQATIAGEGGVQPYRISVDGNALQPLTGPVTLTAGTHMIRFVDNALHVAPAQFITVPQTLSITEPQYECDGGNYRARFKIVGGTPFYSVNGELIEADSYTTQFVLSGTDFEVKIVDSHGCETSATLNFVCAPLCFLPCGGEAESRGYRFWLPDGDDSDAYRDLKISKLVFEVEGGISGEVQEDLSGDVAGILQANPADLTEAIFPNLAADWVRKINDAILARSSLRGSNGEPWLALTYEQVGPGRFGRLWIQHFKCLQYKIEMTVNYSTSDRNETIVIAYAPGLATYTDQRQTTEMPPYDGYSTNLCDKEPTQVMFCKKKPNFKLKWTRDVKGRTVTAEAQSPLDPNIALVWELQDGSPPVGGGETFKSQVIDSAGKKTLTLNVIDRKNGCTASETAVIEIG